MKKLYYFIAGYVIIMMAIGIIPMSKMKLSAPAETLPAAYEAMLMTAGIMAVALLLALVVWRIVKFILVKLGKHPDDYFQIRVDAQKTIDHWLLTTNGKYDKKNDKAELERDKRNNQTVEW